MFQLIGPFVVAVVAAVVLTPLARAFALRLDIVDRPDGVRKLQEKATPYCGGLAVYGALLFGMALATFVWPVASASLTKLTGFLAVSAGLMCLAGMLDDRLDLRPRHKLLLQVVGTLPLILGGCYIERIGIFGFPVELGIFGIPLTIFWLVACVNALNLLDGMDGLASVIGIASCAMIALIAGTGEQAYIAVIAIAMAGALIGFLAYNLPPASIYLGDSGSMIIGLVVGALAIFGSSKTSATLTITVPVLIMTVPMMDTAFAVLRRRLTGKQIGEGDRGHIHHRLLDRGLSNWQALWIIGSLCLATGTAAMAAKIWRIEAVSLIVVLCVVVLLVRLRLFGHYEISLVKLATANVLSNLAHRLVDPRDEPLALDPTDLAQLPFVEAMEKLGQSVAKWNVERLEFVVVEEEADRETVIWQNADYATAANHINWNYEMTYPRGETISCALRVSGSNASSAEPMLLLHLAKVVQPVGAFWAEQLGSQDEATLRFPGASDTAAEQEADTRRAA